METEDYLTTLSKEMEETHHGSTCLLRSDNEDIQEFKEAKENYGHDTIDMMTNEAVQTETRTKPPTKVLQKENEVREVMKSAAMKNKLQRTQREKRSLQRIKKRIYASRKRGKKYRISKKQIKQKDAQFSREKQNAEKELTNYKMKAAQVERQKEVMQQIYENNLSMQVRERKKRSD